MPIVDVQIKNTDIEDKFSRLDVKAKTSNKEIINIEIPKLKKLNSEDEIVDMLEAWVEFLRDPESEVIRKLEMKNSEIREVHVCRVEKSTLFCV